MSISKKTIVTHLVSVLFGLLCTAITFICIPMLTHFSNTSTKKEQQHHVLISQRKPPPPPSPERDEELEQKKRQQPKEVKKTARVSRPKIDLQVSTFGSNIGGIKISGLINKDDFDISDSLFVSAFKPSEVDQPPRVLRAMPPLYPFEAQQKGIEGRVVLRFVVDSNGKVHEPQVVEANPEGVFEKTALAAIAKYRFRPAMKGGEAVDCIVRLPIAFDLNT
ncbi:energy transducer TonB [Thermodesulfobacteriota bacterium]